MTAESVLPGRFFRMTRHRKRPPSPARPGDYPVLRSYVLAELQRAALRARLASPTSMPSVLRLKPVGPQDAVEALADAGALEYLEATPTNTGSAS